MNEIISISAVEPQKKKKDRFNIYSDGDYLCSLGAESIVMFGIKKGAGIEEEELKRAIEEDNTRYAFDSAVNLITFKMRAKKEIRDKLKEKKINESAVEKAIEKLEGYGYINDVEYAKEFVKSSIAAARYGKKVVEYKLKQKGINDDTIDEAMQMYTYEDEIRIAQKHYKALLDKKECEERYKLRSRVYSTLMRRGFSSDVINSVLSEDEEFE